MSLRSLSKLLPAFALAAMATIVTVPALAEGNAARGKTLSYTCLGCHGVETYKNVYPTFSVPKLRGQHAEYIVSALQEYAKGERSHATMHAHASSLSAQDIEDIATFFSAVPVKSANKTVGTPPAAAAACVACHGQDGVGIQEMYPTLSGQYADYIEHALESYRNGARKNPIMEPFANQLKPQEIRQVAEYFSKQQPSLKTLPRNEKLTAAK